MTPAEMVREFHEAFGIPQRGEPTLPGVTERRLRRDLLEEEFLEYEEADRLSDIIGVADGLADMVYVIYGTALAYGIDLDAVLAEVHRSNMTKLGSDGRPVFREDGKVQKGEGFESPRIAEVLNV